MLRIRRFEEQCVQFAKAKQFSGHYHVYIGQEATAVAACAALGPEDFVFTTWRNHGHLLARGADPERMMAEILGKSDGYAGGKSGSLHMSVRELGVPATSALVGGALPLATGAALACKYRGSRILCVSSVTLRWRRELFTKPWSSPQYGGARFFSSSKKIIFYQLRRNTDNNTFPQCR